MPSDSQLRQPNRQAPARDRSARSLPSIGPEVNWTCPGATCRSSLATVWSAAGPLEAADPAGRGSPVSRPPVRRAAKRLWIGDGQWSYTQIVVRAASIPSPLSKTLEKMYGGQTPVSGPTIAGLRPHIPPVASTVHALPHAVAPSTSPAIRARTASGSRSHASTTARRSSGNASLGGSAGESVAGPSSPSRLRAWLRARFSSCCVQPGVQRVSDGAEKPAFRGLECGFWAWSAALTSRTDWAGHFAVVQDDRIRLRPLPVTGWR